MTAPKPQNSRPPQMNSRPDLTLSRTFDAPRDLVFKVWTEPRHVAQWWGPHEFTIPHCELDVRPGGAMQIHMRAPDGTLYPTQGRFQEVVEPERLVFTTLSFPDASGIAQLEVLQTVTFEEQQGKTTVTLTAAVLKATPEMAGVLSGMEPGWQQGFDRLAQYLETMERSSR